MLASARLVMPLTENIAGNVIDSCSTGVDIVIGHRLLAPAATKSCAKHAIDHFSQEATGNIPDAGTRLAS